MDILICHGPNDNNIIDLNIKYNKENVAHRNMYIVSHDPDLVKEGCIVIHEDILPFKHKIMQLYPNNKSRWGWYLQQLIKIHAHIFIPEISENYLTIDCDSLFIKPTSFFENDIPLYNYVIKPIHTPYFEHMKRMHKDLTQIENSSGICHHMIFNTKILIEMFTFIEQEYNSINNTKYSFFEIFMVSISESEFSKSGASEYELYFNYIQKYHTGDFKLRQLLWDENVRTITQIQNYDIQNTKNNYISCHHWRNGR